MTRAPSTCCFVAAVLAALLAVGRAYEIKDIVPVSAFTQAAFVSDWRYDPSMMCVPTGLRGPVQKTGLGHSLWSILDRNHSTDASLPEIQAGIPIYASIQVFISHKYKFIYLRQPKSSSTSIIASLFHMLCERPAMCESGEIVRLRGHLSNDTVWRDYFVFTVVRNPIARMLSTYVMFLDLLRKREAGSRDPGEFCSIPFLSFSESVLRLRSACDTDRCCAYHETHQFVDHFVNSHISQQVHAVFTPEGEPIVDFIGATEHIQEDWERIVAEIRRRSGATFPLLPIQHSNSGGSHKGGLARLDLETPAKDVSADGDVPPCISRDVAELGLINETTVFNIAKQFAMDMVFLKFSRPA